MLPLGVDDQISQGHRALLHSALEGVQTHVERTVSDGVYRDLHPKKMRGEDQIVQLALLEKRRAPLAGGVGVILPQKRGSAPKGAVAEELQRANLAQRDIEDRKSVV